MTREDIDRIASEYFNDKESEHEMDEVFYLAKKGLEEWQEVMLKQIRAEILSLPTKTWNMVQRTSVLDIIDKYKAESEDKE